MKCEARHATPCKWNQSLQKENIAPLPVGDLVFEKLQYGKGYMPI